MVGLCWLWSIQGVAGLCQFPSYLQTNVTRADEPVDYRQRQSVTAADGDVTQGGGGRTRTVEWRRRDWRSGVRDQATSWTTMLTFDGALMTVERVAAETSLVDDDDVITARSFQCQCLEEINGNSYLIRHQLLEQPARPLPDNVMFIGNRDESFELINYACVQFVRRSAAVVQLRISAATSKQHNRTLCDDAGLRWEKWLMVDMAAVFQQSTSGVRDESGDDERLAGGFSVRVFEAGSRGDQGARSRGDKAWSRGDQGVCDGYRRAGDTRIEADCVPGDGLYFYFWSAACVPPGAYMYATQKTICRASWSDDVYTYVVLTHNRLSYAWLLRYPAVLVADSFTAHLLRDLAADDSPHATWTGGKHWRLDMVRDVQRPVTSLCVDDVDACRSWTLQLACGSAPSMALACPRTCGICNESRPVVCTFRSDLVGDWVALADPDQSSSAPSVVVGASTMTVRSGDSVAEKFHCVTWSDERRRSAGEEMVVTEHFDGCRPRYTCIRYQRRADALLQLRLSQSRMWPLVNAVDQPVDCRAFSYDDDDDDDSAGRTLRGQRFRLLYSRKPRPPTACQLPLPPDNRSLRNYTLMYNNGTQCRGTSVTEALDGLGLLFSVGDCGPGVTPGTRTTLLHCIKSSRLSTGDGVALVTRSVSTPTDIRCWFYATGKPEPEMYWLAAADCGAVVRRVGSSASRLQHVAVLLPAARANQFRRQTGHVTSTLPPQRHLPADRRRNDRAYYALNISDAPLTPDTAGADTNSTPETKADTDEEPAANVFVVFAAMVIFTLLHIPCNLCRVSA